MAPTTQRAAPPAPQDQTANGIPTVPASGAATGEVIVNRKKQKRRQKQAARLAAEQPSEAGLGSSAGHAPNGHVLSSHTGYDQLVAQPRGSVDGTGYGHSDIDDPYEPRDGEDLYYSDEDGRYVDNTISRDANGKAKRKKKNRSRSEFQHEYQSSYPQPPSSASTHNPPPPPPPPPPMSTDAVHSAHKVSKDRIWNTSTQEERERIKEFWLSLEEKERRSLVKVEKEAVLKKMKEQQKHSCSCTVCGRKRTAIEEELEVLYDAYYEELEQYANHQQISLDDGTPIMQPPRMYSHPMARLPSSRPPPLSSAPRPAKGRIHELIEDDEDLDEDEFSEEEEDEDEEYSDEEFEEEPRGPAADFFNFGNSLTVQGGILTVADDLLKNDGKKFIEMMEQLAERRMQREEEAQYAAAGLRHPSMQGHGHGPPLEEDEYDDEDDEDYDSADDEDYDEDEMEAMTEEQRMEEGRRMFQIFAARMFEQRVLTAYREKVARERQERLLEELADESRLDAQREAKKAKEAAKKKDKKRQQKLAKEEERAKREADKAAEEAALKAIEEQKLEEQRLKREEQRKKREAEKKAQEEERLKKESEKQRKLQEAREQHAEAERRQREQKERDRKKKEENKMREREERESKEREAKERKEREAAERREREAKAKADKENARVRKEEQSTKQAPQLAPVPIPPLARNKASTAVPLPPGLQVIASNHASPHLQIATPVIPKAPTPVRPRQPSVQGSHQSSPKSVHVHSGSSATSPSSSMPQKQQPTSTVPKPAVTTPSAQKSQAAPTLQPIIPPPGMHPHPYPGMPGSAPIMSTGYPMNFAPMMPGMMPRVPPGHESQMFHHHHQPFNSSQYRNFAAPNGLPFPPGINGARPAAHGRGSPMDIMTSQAPVGSSTIGSPAISSPYGVVHSTMPTHSRSHSRHESASFDKPNFDSAIQPQTQPIARPAPIRRPSSTPHQPGEDDQRTNAGEIDDLANHLGSSALLADSNVDDKQGSILSGGLGSARLGFGASPMFSDPLGSAKMENFPRGVQSGNSWGAPPQPFGTPSMSNQGSWSNASGSGWPSHNAFGIIGGPNRHASRPVTVRLLACQACKQLTSNNSTKNGNGFYSIDSIMRQVEQLKPPHEGPIQLRELLQICDTEGNAQNGGGSFTIQDEPPHGIWVKWEPENNGHVGARGAGAPGEIGSPMMGSNMAAFGGARAHQPPGGGIASPSGF